MRYFASFVLLLLIAACTAEQPPAQAPPEQPTVAVEGGLSDAEMNAQAEIIALEEGIPAEEARNLVGSAIRITDAKPTVEFMGCYDGPTGVGVMYLYTPPSGGTAAQRFRLFSDACIADRKADWFCSTQERAARLNLDCTDGCANEVLCAVPTENAKFDLTGDGAVDQNDFAQLEAGLSSGSCPTCDLNGDGNVSAADLASIQLFILESSAKAVQTTGPSEQPQEKCEFEAWCLAADGETKLPVTPSGCNVPSKPFQGHDPSEYQSSKYKYECYYSYQYTADGSPDNSILCDRTYRAARDSCYATISTLPVQDGKVDASGIPTSPGAPGTLYVDGPMVLCSYGNQAEAVKCSMPASGGYCNPRDPMSAQRTNCEGIPSEPPQEFECCEGPNQTGKPLPTKPSNGSDPSRQR